jgi:hypothetical protein
MNRNKLKTYAPEARRDFIQAMKDRAAFYGLTASKTEPAVVRGDVAVIAGRDYPRAIADKRKKLEARVERDGFEQTMEALAYTWFNRLVAIRFMELHGYLDHGYRVLSHPDGKQTPEILDHAEHVELPGLKKDRAIDLKLEGNKESELYRLLLTAQCNALHRAMPFLFERIDDETELLLPDNLLHSDSLVRKLVDGIDEDDWKEVEVIGWLYQFYISEKKDEVIGKVVANADIPAATQLFTPNWIVKYLVQNTLGRQWLATYPKSALRAQMEYYIEPAEQVSEVRDQIKAITPVSLDPEALTMLDPACGSCHILVEGYDLFKAIYLERGYRLRDIPALILKKNLFGLEIDDRAAQLGAFALMMKARADDRRIFDNDAKPNVHSFQESNAIDLDAIATAVNGSTRNHRPREYLFDEIEDAEVPLLTVKRLNSEERVSKADIASVLELFRDAKTFGSLIHVPPSLSVKLTELKERIENILKSGDLVGATSLVLKPLLEQAQLLAGQYDFVLANPPYMGNKYYAPTLKDFIGAAYKDAKSDLYACFMERNAVFAKADGFVAMITIPNWMFLSSFEKLRKGLIQSRSIDTFIHNGRGVFGSDFGSCAFTFRNTIAPTFRGSYRRLFDKQGSVASNQELSERFHSAATWTPRNDDFAKIPGSPLAYWAHPAIVNTFASHLGLGEVATGKVGLLTSDNARFLRFWWEVSTDNLCLRSPSSEDAAASGKRWFPHNKGGSYRKWYGNQDYVVDWEENGRRIKETVLEKYPYLNGDPNFVVHDDGYYFAPSISWSEITIGATAFRYYPEGFTFNVKGMSAFPLQGCSHQQLLSLCNANFVQRIVEILNPTVGFGINNFRSLPAVLIDDSVVRPLVDEIIKIAKQDWDVFETSWDFEEAELLRHRDDALEQAMQAVDKKYVGRFERMKVLEKANNELYINACKLNDDFSSEVPDDQITLYRSNHDEEIKRLLSFAVGCAMGRYSLDKPGLIIADSNFDRLALDNMDGSFKVDEDGIVPILEADWGFQDDGVNRVVEFLSVAWPNANLNESLKFIAKSLGTTSSDSPRDAIRRYLGNGFYKNHLTAYKRRPIYWMFSSGKSRAFQCLVYLHRYHEGTLARMRTVYVIPLQGQMASRIDQIESEKVGATSTSHRKKLQKEQDELRKQQAELLIFEAKLKHFADQKISLDLDDGVKVNYGKFGDLLAEVKAITGGKDDE